MFSDFRKALRALHELPSVLEGLQIVHQEGYARLQGTEELLARVHDLETSVHRIVAEAEGLVLKAESRFAAARAAEERTRGMEKRTRALQAGTDQDDEEGVDAFEQLAHLHGNNAAGGQPAGVPAVQPGVALSGKDAARARKWGVS